MADKLKRCPFCGGEAELHIEKQGLRWEANIICKRAFYGLNRCPANMGLFQLGDDKEETIKTITSRWNTRATPWHTGTPTVKDPFYVREVFILQFATPTGGWYFHGHLFKPDFSNKCFRSWVDKSIIFEFDYPNLWWQKIEP